MDSEIDVYLKFSQELLLFNLSLKVFGTLVVLCKLVFLYWLFMGRVKWEEVVLNILAEVKKI